MSPAFPKPHSSPPRLLCWEISGVSASWAASSPGRLILCPRSPQGPFLRVRGKVGWRGFSSRTGQPTDPFRARGTSSPPQGLEAEHCLMKHYFIWRRFWNSNSLLLYVCGEYLCGWCVCFRRNLWILARLTVTEVLRDGGEDGAWPSSPNTGPGHRGAAGASGDR